MPRVRAYPQVLASAFVGRTVGFGLVYIIVSVGSDPSESRSEVLI